MLTEKEKKIETLLQMAKLSRSREQKDIYLATIEELMFGKRITRSSLPTNKSNHAETAAIQEYLDGIDDDKVCICQIWIEALDHHKKPTKMESMIIAEILDTEISCWRRHEPFSNLGTIPGYGRQKYWERDENG